MCPVSVWMWKFKQSWDVFIDSTLNDSDSKMKKKKSSQAPEIKKDEDYSWCSVC